MDDTAVRRWLSELEERLRKADWLDETLEIRDQAILLLERAFGPENPLVLSAQKLQPSLLDLPRRHTRIKNELNRILRNARFRIDLDTNPLPGDLPPRGLTYDAQNALLVSIKDLIGEAERAAIPLADREQIVALLHRAETILSKEGHPTSQQADLQQVLGQAVTKAARPGPAATIWRRIAEFVMLAEAAVSLGLGVAAIMNSTAARIEVVCQVDLPALPAAPQATSPADHAPSDAEELVQEPPTPADHGDLPKST